MRKRFTVGALFGGIFFFTCFSLPALAQFTCTTTTTDITCTNSGTAGDETNGASGAGQNANSVNTGTVTGYISTWATSGNATSVNSWVVNGYIATQTFSNRSAGTFNSGTTGSIATMTWGGANAMTVNSGTVNGVIQTSAWNGGDATTINSGTVRNPGETAVQLDGGNTTLTILPGSLIVGDIKLGGSSDTVNLRERNVDLTFSNLANATITGTVPYVVSGNRIVSVDPTSFGFTDRALLDFTHTLSGFLSDAPAGEPGGFKDGNAASFAGANGVTPWAKGFYGRSLQPARGISLSSVTNLSGGAMGFDTTVGPGLRVGALAGGGEIKSSTASNGGSAESDIGFGGLYVRYDAGAAFLDTVLIGGGLSNRTLRNVNNNMAQSGLETATASFRGWFAEPEVALGYRYVLTDRWTLTPVLKARYLSAGLDGYSEMGSAANLTIAGRVQQDLEERAELVLTGTLTVDSEKDLRVSLHGGVLGLERIGDKAVNANLLGKSLGFAAPGKDSVAGAYGGAGLDFRIGNKLSLYLSGEYAATNDQASLVTAKGGLRWRF